MTDSDLVAAGRAIIDRITYITLATIDSQGRPWASPVFYATADYRDFYWISAPTTTHSRNIAECAQVSIVVFDSTVAPGTGQAVYAMADAARLVVDADVSRALTVYPGPPSRGARPMGIAELEPPSPYRLYRATVTEQSMMCPRDSGPCEPHGIAHDHRTPVRLWDQL